MMKVCMVIIIPINSCRNKGTETNSRNSQSQKGWRGADFTAGSPGTEPTPPATAGPKSQPTQDTESGGRVQSPSEELIIILDM